MTTEYGCPHHFQGQEVHYCTYIKVPALENLMSKESNSARLMLKAALMVSELWFKVMLLDAKKLQAAIRSIDEGSVPDLAPVWDGLKLTRRGVALGRLLIQQFFLIESELNGKLEGKAATSNPSRQLNETEVILDAILADRNHQAGGKLAQDSAEYESMTERLESGLREWRLLLSRVEQALIAQTVLPDNQTYEDFSEQTQLLALADQSLVSEWHDETMFIVVHQATELWFYVIIDLLQNTAQILNALPSRAWQAVELMRRAAMLKGLLAQQIQLPLTMFPSDFLQFRGKLDSSSGLESYQFRVIEMASGLRDEVHLHRIKVMGGPKLNLLIERFTEILDPQNGISLTQSWRKYIQYRGITQSNDPTQIAQDMRQLYQTTSEQFNPDLDIIALAEEMIQFERNLRLWRDAHVGMVAQMIGTQPGTGASSGVAYLRQTMNYEQLYPELWQVRTILKLE
jgi:tryptophan 2,3-dioxygenase